MNRHILKKDLIHEGVNIYYDIVDDFSFNKKLEPNGFSIIIPIFNRGENAARSLSSILQQQYIGPPVEIIVVNDGSTDNSIELVRSVFKYRKDWVSDLSIVNMPNSVSEWSSPSRPYNYGFSLSRYNYIIHSGADSIWLSNDMMSNIYKYCDIDIYLFFRISHISIGDVEKISYDRIFVDSKKVSIIEDKNHPQCYFPFLAITSYDSLKKIGFYSDEFKAAAGEDDELLQKLTRVGIKYCRILKNFIGNQSHDGKCINKGKELSYNIQVIHTCVKRLHDDIIAGKVEQYEGWK